MKYFIPLVAVFAAGIVASFAFASPPPGKGPNTSTSTSTTTHGNNGAAKCRPMNLMGKGKVSVQAWACSAPGSTAAPQLTLRQLHAGGSPQAPTTTTTP